MIEMIAELLFYYVIFNLACIPIYIACKTWEDLKSLFWTAQVFGLMMTIWILFHQIPPEQVADAMRQGYGYRLFA